MMVNVSRFVPVQKAVRDFLSLREKRIRGSGSRQLRDAGRGFLKKRVHAGPEARLRCRVCRCWFTWAEVKAALSGVFEHLHLYVINSKSDEVLDYARYAKEGSG